VSAPENIAAESAILMLDISKAVHILGWSPRLSLKDAVRLTIEEYRVMSLTEQEIYNQRSRHIDEYMNLMVDL
jgi:dTDP-D-glucose 4,6-dehydratase